ncbi:hypothetical protein FF011L_44670 [Roseimaritima multifibrata]|uniref:Tetratricopeptide repeat protein n=1 Tax=Roseimaritima multifibrata TaxID=1930274 RepID=A0A517MLN0_9BACT|nr:hypothetical protein [Roseimaritima multifibrata]QDS95667.1 hypothetical protein FF011L_44670 [Roseimaritima multifibrata]
MEPDDTIWAIRHRAGEWDASDIDQLIDLSKSHPDDPYLLDVLGDLSRVVKHPSLPDDFAFRCYTQAVAADPSYSAAHLSLGYWHDTMGNLPDAKNHFLLAIASGSDEIARVPLASVLAQLGDRTSAYVELDKCVDSEDLDVSRMRTEIENGQHDPLDIDLIECEPGG